ncbi:MAG: radical SAM protein, partial [Clostridia bacterium]|nr:radical SAM protein [Clostridia bacterium]
LVKHPPSRMNISLYGCSNETYSRLCGVPAYEDVKKNILRLKSAGINIKLNASITPYNAEDIEGIYAFGETYHMPVQATTYMYPPVRINGCKYGCAPARFTAEEAAKQMLRCREQYMSPEELRSLSTAAQYDDTDCSVEGEGEGMRCRAGRTAFWVTWSGCMLPCGMFPSEGYSIANMGFEAAWESVKADTATIRMPRECTGCASKKRCSVCAASVMAETGSTFVRPDYICQMTKTLEQLTYEKYGKTEE